MKSSPRLIRAFAVGLLATTSALAVDTEMKELSLSELMGLQNAIGTLTRMEKNKVPVSVTTITEEDIRMTPARNLLDLIEALVPGAMYTDHPEQARLGMRGVIVDRNYKFLLLVDGHLMNQKTHSGVVSEIQNWDMNDIKEIQIIRGPGSVTYGPGAVAGVVAITTKKAEDAPGTKLSSSMAIPYASQGGTVQYGKVGDGWSLYSYLNATWTRGYKDPKGFGENGNAAFASYSFGQIGTSDHKVPGRRLENNDLLADFDRDVPYMPQMRAHLNATLPLGFTAFGRYTQGGTTTGAALSKHLDSDSLSRTLVNSRTFLYRQATASLKHQHQFTSELGLSSKIEAGSQDFERYSGTRQDSSSMQSPLNTTHNFAESDVTFQALLNTSFLEKYQIALGAEYVYSKVGAGWFDDLRAMRFGDGQNLVSGPDSWLVTNDTAKGNRTTGAAPQGMKWGTTSHRLARINDNGIFVGDGIGSHTFSIMSEANLAFHEYATLLVSGRADKNTYSTWMVSPRVALVSAITNRNIVKAIWQRSMRMGTLEQMYLESEINGGETDPEVLEGIEVIYTALPTDAWTINLSGYRNEVETIGWSTVNTKTELQGDMVILGGEADVAWRNETWTVGVNHAISTLESFELAEGQTKSGVSYADMDMTIPMTVAVGSRTLRDTVRLKGAGESINNWAEQISKLNVRFKATPTLTLQASSRVFWDFQGYQDQLDVLKGATSTQANDTVFTKYMKPKIDSLVAFIEDEDPFGTQLRVDLSADWAMSEKVRVTAMVQNAFGVGKNQRMDYISGLNHGNPRAAWVEEPRTYYVKFSSAF